MEMLLHFMVAFFLIVPGVIILGAFFIQMIAFALESNHLRLLGQIFCPVNERRDLSFSEKFDTMYAEDVFFGDGGISAEIHDS